MKNDIVKMDIEVMRSLTPAERFKALNLRKEWVVRERKQERKEDRNLRTKIYTFKNKLYQRILYHTKISHLKGMAMDYKVRINKDGSVVEYFG